MISFLILKNKNTNNDLMKESLEKNIVGEHEIIELIEKESFKSDLLNVINNLKSDFICITRSDCLAYNKINIESIKEMFGSDGDVLCFSLILGKNTEICLQMETKNTLYDQEEIGNTMKWDWTKHYLDYGNPFYLDGTVFRKKEIYKMIRSLTFDNSEKLEESFQEVYSNYPKSKMASFITNNIVVIEHTKLEDLDKFDFNKVKSFVI